MNFALKPERKSIGQLSYVNLDDQSIEQFGAAKMKDLVRHKEQIMDAYACINVSAVRRSAPRTTQAKSSPRWRSTNAII
ncbi:MAG: hypothetical protein U0X92_17060 [Anaerolineales bacterium]